MALYIFDKDNIRDNNIIIPIKNLESIPIFIFLKLISLLYILYNIDVYNPFINNKNGKIVDKENIFTE